MSAPADSKPALKALEGGRVLIERDIVHALAVGDDAKALAAMATLERRAQLESLPAGTADANPDA
ncbi:hypothetical protein [Aquimonas sp.]|uniref:hypothetical protein n=1 Tax=Aquimonas sp. TaxID=1872588 RepID=UPI0037BFDC62